MKKHVVNIKDACHLFSARKNGTVFFYGMWGMAISPFLSSQMKNDDYQEDLPKYTSE